MQPFVAAQRIASLLASATEILHGIGVWDRVVAVSHECDYPPEAALKPRVTAALIDEQASSKLIDEQVRQRTATHDPLYRIDVDRLAALKPDLIITQSQCDVCAVRYDDVVAAVRSTPALEGARIVALNPTCFRDLFEDIKKVGEATGVRERAQRFVDGLSIRMARIRAETDDIRDEERPRVACVEWIDPVMIAANWMPELLRLAGGRCDLTNPRQRSGYSNWESVVAFDPEIIVLMPCGFDLNRTIKESQVLSGFDRWSNIAAVRNGRVFAVDGNAYFNRAGPRLVDSLELLAGLIHPDRFAQHRIRYRHAWRSLYDQAPASGGNTD